jgi:hypothetical protein
MTNMTKTPSVRVSIAIVTEAGEDVSHAVKNVPLPGGTIGAVVSSALAECFSAVSPYLPGVSKIVANLIAELDQADVLLTRPGHPTYEPIERLRQAAGDLIAACEIPVAPVPVPNVTATPPQPGHEWSAAGSSLADLLAQHPDKPKPGTPQYDVWVTGKIDELLTTGTTSLHAKQGGKPNP